MSISVTLIFVRTNGQRRVILLYVQSDLYSGDSEISSFSFFFFNFFKIRLIIFSEFWKFGF